MNETIYSLVTKPINQNVGIIRISGINAFEAIKKIAPNFKPAKNHVEFQKISNNDGFIDDVLILSFIAPHSFTGENIIEIHCHGSLFIIQKIISELNKFGLRQSKPGEFMLQAYLNGKIDLLQAEAINTIIKSENKILTEKSLSNLNGKQSNFIDVVLNKLSDIVSRIQISIDYPENTDLPQYNLSEIKKTIKKMCIEFEQIIVQSKKLINYSKGIKITLIGIPNAGKSTLLNKILNENRAIVSNIAGTTRDIVDSTIYINDIKVTIQDTAGIREETNDPLEIEGIKRTIEATLNADIVLILYDGTKNIFSQKKIFSKMIKTDENKFIEIISKADLKKNEHPLNVSSIDETFLKVVDKIKEFIEINIFNENENTMALLISQTQIDNFKIILNSLNTIIKLIDDNQLIDIIAFELENLLKNVGKIIGKKIDQNYLSNLFSNFCIGK